MALILVCCSSTMVFFLKIWTSWLQDSACFQIFDIIFILFTKMSLLLHQLRKFAMYVRDWNPQVLLVSIWKQHWTLHNCSSWSQFWPISSRKHSNFGLACDWVQYSLDMCHTGMLHPCIWILNWEDLKVNVMLCNCF